jgi:5'-nucleotidase
MEMNMKVLLTNDDGIKSSNIRKLAYALAEKGHDVSVFAPASQKSACSHSLTVHDFFSYTEEKWEGISNAVAVSGSPADCVKFAVNFFGIKPDIVVTGPNEGCNLGTDTMYSGTVAGAMEGVICGFKAIALSVCGDREMRMKPEKLISFFVSNFDTLAANVPEYGILNINYPESGEAIGVKVTKTGKIFYTDYYEERMTDGIKTYKLRGETIFQTDDEEDCDVKFSQRGYITVSPLRVDKTDYEMLARMHGLEEKLVLDK